MYQITPYSQKDPRWAGNKLGSCATTIGKDGCKVTCYAMFDGRSPEFINLTLSSNNGYHQGCLTVDELDCKILGLEYHGKSSSQPDYPCIAETDRFKPAQHFFVVREDGMILDPLDLNPGWKPNPYHIVSYRLIKPKQKTEEPVDDREEEKQANRKEEILEALKGVIGWKDRITAKERDAAIDWIKAKSVCTEAYDTLQTENAQLRETRKGQEKTITEQALKIKTLQDEIAKGNKTGFIQSLLDFINSNK